MPWPDRVRAVQVSDLVTFGIRVRQPAATPPSAT
jgi:hypothetical protein